MKKIRKQDKQLTQPLGKELAEVCQILGQLIAEFWLEEQRRKQPAPPRRRKTK